VGRRRRRGSPDQSQVAEAVRTWEQQGRDDGDLYRGLRLESALEWVAANPDAPSPLERDFITSSADAREAEIEAEREQAERERRSNRRLRALLAGVGVLLVIALVAGALAIRQQRRADDEAGVAREAAAEAERQQRRADDEAAAARDAAAEAERQTEVAVAAVEDADLATLISRSAAQTVENPEVSMLLALEAVRRAPGPETEQAVLNALGSSRIPNRVATFPGLDVGDCPTPTYLSHNGLTEFAVAEGRLISLDLTTGLVDDHGPSPDECGVWWGDPATDRVVVGGSDAERNWIGFFDDPDAIELEQSGPMFLVNTDFAGDVVAYVVPGQQLNVQLFDAKTGEPIGEPIGADGLWSVEIDSTGSFAALGTEAFDDTNGSGGLLVVDATTGEQLYRIDTAAPPASLTFDPTTLELIAGMVDGGVVTVDLVTGEIVSSVTTTATAPVGRVGVRHDGLIVAVSNGQIELVDRRTRATSVVAELRDAVDARVRPDGTVVTLGSDGDYEVIELEGNALVERSWPVDPFVRVAFNDGKAGLRGLGRTVEIVDLATGERTEVKLRTPEGNLFPTEGVYPEPDGVWAIAWSGVVARWESETMVERIEFPGELLSWTRFDDTLAVLSADADGNPEASLVSLVHDEAGDLFTIPAPNGYSVHPALNGGLHVFDEDGTLRTYDSSGELIGELTTGAQNPLVNTMDPSTGVLAVSSDPAGVVVIDPTRSEVQQLPGDDRVANLGFARDGQLLVITGFDGTVRIWDLVRGEPAGLVWDGNGGTLSSPSWYDKASDSIWVYTSGRLLQIPLDPERWVERACDIVGRDLTSDEWQRYVPGDDALQSACA
jgi:WD40 repeat protein